MASIAAQPEAVRNTVSLEAPNAITMTQRMPNNNAPWYEISNVDEIPSPALVVYPDRIEENIRRMLSMVGGPDRLRPHIKTHKMPEIMRLQLAAGINKFKAATIAETEMAAAAGASDVLLAYQPVGPNIGRFIELMRRFPQTRFSAVADDADAIRAIGAAATAAGIVVELILDIDCGQRRSGIEAGPHAAELYRLIASTAGLAPAGLHVYDGHLSMSDPDARAKAVRDAMAPVDALRKTLTESGYEIKRVIAGGTPTFPMHAARPDVECGPGTCVLWDHDYDSGLPDMSFLPAALVLTRVVSKPSDGLVCFDLGHKSIAAEKPQPRVRLYGLEEATFVTHSEEHLVAKTDRAGEIKVGDAYYGVPLHICPTVALHGEAVVVRDGKASERWKVAARERKLTI